MPVIDVDRETAHEAAQAELAKPIYPRASLGDRIAEWVNDLLHRLIRGGSELPGGWFTIVVLVLLTLAAVLVAAHLARRTMGARGRDRLYTGRPMTAADHRRNAEHAAAQGDWADAIRQRVRAIGRQLEEGGVLDPVPGRTSDELAAEAGAALPGLAVALRAAATASDEVTYGDRPGTEPDYRSITDLDDRIPRTTAPADTAVTAR